MTNEFLEGEEATDISISGNINPPTHPPSLLMLELELLLLEMDVLAVPIIISHSFTTAPTLSLMHKNNHR